jgi:hypothetical protein
MDLTEKKEFFSNPRFFFSKGAAPERLVDRPGAL